MKTHLLQAAVAALCLACSGDLRAENWPCWRGSAGDGLSREMTIPTMWSETTNVRWKMPIPGVGHSSPIVWGDAVFVTSCLEDKSPAERILIRLDRRTGAVVWQKTVLKAPLEKIHRLNSRASSTPATDGKRVFVSFLDGKKMFIAAYDMAGEKLWEVRPGPFSSVHGYCTNPVLYKDWMFVNGDHDGDAFLAMLKQSDGSIVWKTPRENRTRSYCTPIIANIDGRDQLLLNGSKCTAGYDAETGKQEWICDGPSEQMVSTLLRGHGLIYSLGGFPERHLLAIPEGRKGRIEASEFAWKSSDSIPYVPSALLYRDLLHVASDEGIYTCFDAKTGRVHTKKRLSKHISSSLVGGCGRVYVTDDTGTTRVLENTASFNEVAVNKLGEEVYASPAIAEGAVFLRGVKHLYCIAEGGTPAAN